MKPIYRRVFPNKVLWNLVMALCCYGFISTALSQEISFSVALPEPTLRTIALTGQQAPGMAAGVTFAQLNDTDSSNTPIVNNAGQITYWARVTGPGITNSVNNQGVWQSSGTASQLSYWSNSFVSNPPPGVPNTFIDTDVAHNSNAQIAFLAGSNGIRDYWLERPSGLTKIASTNALAPGTPYNFGTMETGVLADNGTFLLRARLQTSSNWGLWIDAGSSLQLLALEDAPAPGTATGIYFENLFNTRPVLNSSGHTAFRGSVGGPGVTSANNSGIWTNRSGSLALFVREGTAAPGTPAGVNFGQIGSDVEHTAINSAGHLAFRAELTGTGVTTANNNGIWTDRSGKNSLYKRAGDAAPGTPAGVNFSSFRAPLLNNQDHLVFMGILSSNAGANQDSGLWSDASGTVKAVALEGAPAPGTPAGTSFGEFWGGASWTLNNSGQMAFSVGLTGTGITSFNDRGIWAQDQFGNLRLIVREGDQLEVLPGDFRTVTSLVFGADSGNGDSMRSGFDDNGGIAFFARFSDSSSGIFYSTLVAVPEPGTYGLIAVLGTVGLLIRRRRSQRSLGSIAA